VSRIGGWVFVVGAVAAYAMLRDIPSMSMMGLNARSFVRGAIATIFS